MDRLIIIALASMPIACSSAAREPVTESGVWVADTTGTGTGDETGDDTTGDVPDLPTPDLPADDGCDFAALDACTTQAGGEMGQCQGACPSEDGCPRKACMEGCVEQRWLALADCYEATGCEAEAEAAGLDLPCWADAHAATQACFEACVDGGADCYVLRADEIAACG